MFKYSWLFSFCFFSFFIQAVEVKDLYQAKVEISSQSNQDRNKAIKQAMKIVLLKVGGQVKIFDQPVINAELRRFKEYLTQYRYERDKEQLYLVVEFNEQRINQLFQQAGLPLWGNLRPKIVVWLIEEDGLSRHFADVAEMSPYSELISSISSHKGIPLVLASLTEENRNNLQLSDFWGRFEQPIKEASQPYAADAIIVIRISNSSLLATSENSQAQQNDADCKLLCEHSQIAVDWSYISDFQTFGERSFGVDKNALITTAFDQISEQLYKKYVVDSDQSNELQLEVMNVDSMEKYVAIVDFLQGLSSVKTVVLTQANKQNRRFTLSLIGSKQALLSSLKLNKQLQQYIDPLGDKYSESMPTFFWQNKEN
jgi:hypothetical protein